MTSLWVEFKCPEHGLERFKVKVIKKYNISPELITPRFRTRPKRELSGIVVGRNVREAQVRDYLVQYFKEVGIMDRILSIRLRV